MSCCWAHVPNMAAPLTGSSPSTGRVKVHCLSTGERQCAKRTAIASAESPRLLRSDWSLILEKPQESAFNSISNRELRGYRWDELYARKYAGWRSRNAMAPINAIASDDSTHPHSDMTIDRWYDAQDTLAKDSAIRSRALEGNLAWDILLQDIQFCDWRARRDVLAIKTLHDKVVDVLNPMARDWKSVQELSKELADLQSQLANAHDQVHLSEARVSRTFEKLSEMESLVNKMLLQEPGWVTHSSSQSHSVATTVAIGPKSTASSSKKSQGLVVAGPVKEFSPSLKNFWYPVAFTDDISKDTMVPFECFEEPWVLFRDQDGRVGCVQNSCAHRACPLHLGEVKDGRIQCPYHGWEYGADGVCEKMPSTKPVKISIQALTCVEHDGMVWIWPGDGVPDENFPVLSAPPGYTTHAQIVIELPVEHGLLMENLLDLAHAPFTHTSTFAKGWPVPSLVKFCTPATALQGYWDPYPIDMEFQPPCMVRSTIGISKPGKLEGNSTQDCAKHLHQLHVCLPSSRGKTRLLYRLSLDFLPILKHVPYIQSLWKYLANKVLDEDLRLVRGQQDRMIRGANVWNLPVSYDKLGVRYRKWRMSVEQRDLMQKDMQTHNSLNN
ncbi:hypothetical protein GOP47_0008593 [Adiantum capillus-veneris]|uniref:Rieske domain-containing protein n=1 Tax=Adiantum capillus-veneris TaxID=13818 RepID=A0A9D4UYW5_ADICA|nr:hypothetical protein GOP47_0008593 [Adiantum capillus-veneris]